MPSPFPGLDPYLEGPEWESFHFAFSVEVARQLAGKLRPDYIVTPNQRFIMGEIDDLSITYGKSLPDVSIRRDYGFGERTRATAVLEPPMMTLVPEFDEEAREVTVEIRDPETRMLVTSIEVISPSNKMSHRSFYLAKRDGMMNRPHVEVWPIEWEKPLPTVPIPLLPEDADTSLDVQSAYSQTYDTFSYGQLLRYDRPPKVELLAADKRWAEGILSEALRSGLLVSNGPSELQRANENG